MLAARFRLERPFAFQEHAVRALLSSSDCDCDALDDVIAGFDEATRARWSRATLGSTESLGLPALREAIARDSEAFGARDVLSVVPPEGILLALSAMIRPGIPVIVSTPAYRSLAEIARFAGGVVHAWNPRLVDGALHFHLADWEAVLAPTKRSPQRPLVIVNFPHNPTGALPTEE